MDFPASSPLNRGDVNTKTATQSDCVAASFINYY